MLIQMPIWIAMFNFVPNAIQLRGESFLWIKDLSTYDPIFEWNTNIWLIGDHLSLTCILFCVANVLYSLMTMRQQRDQMVGQQAEQMKMMQHDDDPEKLNSVNELNGKHGFVIAPFMPADCAYLESCPCQHQSHHSELAQTDWSFS